MDQMLKQMQVSKYNPHWKYHLKWEISFATVEWDDLSHNIIIYIPVDFMKSVIQYVMSGKAWDLVFEQRV